MSFDPLAFAEHYRTLSGGDRQQALYNLEARYSAELLDPLLSIAADRQEYDLARIEAVKVLALAATDHPGIEARVLALILGLVTHDPDDDIRLHALLTLHWLPSAATATARDRLGAVARSDSCPLVREAAEAFHRSLSPTG